jgi:hypothetical protein
MTVYIVLQVERGEGSLIDRVFGDRTSADAHAAEMNLRCVIDHISNVIWYTVEEWKVE